MRPVSALTWLVCLLPGAAMAQSPSRPPAALTEAMRTCPDGGFALPGSATCLRVSGQVTSETSLRATSHGGAAPTLGVSLREHARVAVDVRTPTEFGPLRVYTSIRLGATPEPDVLHR